MPKNGFVMRFFGCVQLPVGVVGAERSRQLSYQGLLSRIKNSMSGKGRK